MKRENTYSDVNRFMLVALGLCVFLVTAGSIALAGSAVPAQQATGSVMVFNPFTLETTLVSGVSATGPRTNALALAIPSSRAVIRIPYRPAVRSAFRPDPV